MNVVFGQLVGNFTDFDPSKAGPGAAAMIRDFEKSLDKLSLYIFALFIGRFFLGYFNKVLSHSCLRFARRGLLTSSSSASA